MFTLGELASAAVFAANFCIFTCTQAEDMWAGAGLAGFLIFKVWEIGNLWFVPKVALTNPAKTKTGCNARYYPRRHAISRPRDSPSPYSANFKEFQRPLGRA